MNDLFLLGSVIVVTYKVKQAMNHHPMKFVVKFDTIFQSILSHGVDADEKIAGEFLSLTIIKGDDVGVIVMVKITEVDIKDIFIGAKYYVNIPNGAYLAAGDKL